MVTPDLLHVINLGVGRDLCGSVLKTILKESHVFAGANIDERMAAATSSLRAFAKSRRLPLRMKKFSKKKLNWGNNRYAELRLGSGYDNYVVSQWLESVLTPHSGTYPDFCALFWSLNNCLNILYHADWFLTADEQSRVKTIGSVFIRVFCKLAAKAVARQEFAWRMKPQFHLFQHVVFSRRCVNAAKYSTWMDEDFLRKISKTMALTPGVTAQERTLQRWMMALPQSILRSMESQ